MNLSHQLAQHAILTAAELLERYGLDRYVESVCLTVDGVDCEWERSCLGCDEVPSVAILRRQLDVHINGDMRAWRETEQEFQRPDALHGYIRTGGFMHEHQRPAVGPIFWYPYTADTAGIKKARHALVVTATENAIHEACELAALHDFPKWNIRDDQEAMGEQFWDAIMEHPAWPHITYEARKSGLHPKAMAKFHFHPEPIKLDIAF